MIRNIIFDMGNVLIRWSPRIFTELYPGLSSGERELLYREAFMSPEWVMQDHGLLREDETVRRVCARLPEHLHPAAEELICRWDRHRMVIDGMYELVEELHAMGYSLFLATNASLRHREYWDSFPVSRFFPRERVMLSADWRLLKPDPAFYGKMLSLFGIDAGETLFIDDNPANVESAILCSIQSIVFHDDPAYLRKDLRALGVGVSE